MALAKLVAYELYTLDYSGWTLHTRFTGSELDDAIDEAKRIEAMMQRATKVVRETYYTETNTTDEAVVRISPNIAEFKRRMVESRQRKAGAKGFATRDLDFADGDATAESQLGTPQIVARMAMMVVSALIIAAAVTGIVSLVLRSPLIAIHVPSSVAPQVLFATFIAVFLLSALPLVSRYLPAIKAKIEPETAKGESRAFLDMPGHKPPPPKDAVAETAAPDAPPALFEGDPGLMAQEPPEPPPAPEPPPPPPPPPKAAPPKAAPQPEPAPEPEPPPTREEIAAAAIERQRISMMRFLTGVLTVLKDVVPQLDAFNKFGLNLVMAGACAEIGRRDGITEAQVIALTTEAIAMLGSKPSLAAAFCRKLDLHAADPRYAAMIAKGAEAFGSYVDGATAPFAAVAEAMATWSTPGDRIGGSNIVTILFTDMVGSTQLTHDRGETAAYDTLLAHNTIVRAALAAHQGVEVKHTGDGIMASFAAPSQAVEAAAAVQCAVRDHNLAMPEQAFHLRIGINAGEPILADDDLFGAAVQLAARICAEAGPDGILVANVVRELVASKGFPMQRLPARILRGFAEPHVLYSVEWAQLQAAGSAPQNAAHPPESAANPAAQPAEPATATTPDSTP